MNRKRFVELSIALAGIATLADHYKPAQAMIYSFPCTVGSPDSYREGKWLMRNNKHLLKTSQNLEELRHKENTLSYAND